MIVSMKKFAMIVQEKDAQKSLKQLRSFGEAHVKPVQEPSSMQLADLKREIKDLERVVDFTSVYGKKNKQRPLKDWERKLNQIKKKIEDHKQLNEEIVTWQNRIKTWERWGSFDPKNIERLNRHGIHFKFYQIPASDLKSIPDHVAIHVLKTEGGLARCVAVSDKQFYLDYEETTLPQKSLTDKKLNLATVQRKLKWVERQLQASGRYYNAFQEQLASFRRAYEFELVHAGMGDEKELVYLTGFCPADKVKQLEECAKEHQWAVLIEDLGEDDEPPTLLRNPKWVELIKPVFGVVEIVPGYREFDVSMIFLIFFTLFFAMLIGDAAYGVIFAGATIFLHIKTGSKVKSHAPFILMYVLTFFTIIWGVLTGTFFGQEWLPSTVEAQLPWLNNFENMQWLCFVVAVVHLTIAKVWSAISRLPSITFLSEVGWMLIVWGMFFVANYFVLGHELPSFVMPLFYAGIPLAFFFMVPPNKFLKVVGQELVPFILGIVGAGTDIVSYIRLFAVGLATVAVADATNSMAATVPEPFNILVLIFGHCLNMVLALMAILVHAIRLNVLEFSGQLGLQWSGYPYQPFKK